MVNRKSFYGTLTCTVPVLYQNVVGTGLLQEYEST